MRILVCGGRDFSNATLMKETLKEYFKEPSDVLIHGCAKGADQLSESIVYEISPDLSTIPSIQRYPADWKKYGKVAGAIRNKQMLDEGKPDCIIAFSGGAGTANMIEQARIAGVPVIIAGSPSNRMPLGSH